MLKGVFGGGQVAFNPPVCIFQNKTTIRLGIRIGGSQEIIKEFPILKDWVYRTT
jgi:hypothetical protein